MSGLAGFRQQNPQYNDMSDAALADALHAKFYADIPKDQYLKNLGLAPAAPAVPGAPARTPTTTTEAIAMIPGTGAAAAPAARPQSVRATNPLTTTGVDMAAATAGAMAGAQGGAALGALGGPFAPATVPIGTLLGGVAGGALGYGASREGQQLVDRARGAAGPEAAGPMAVRVTNNLIEGAQAEAGGRIAGGLIGRGVNALAGAAGRVADFGNTAANKTASILREAAGDRLPAVMNALRNTPEGVTPAQAIATAGVEAPVLQTALRQATRTSAGAVNRQATTAGAQRDEALAGLRALAGGTTVTETRQAAQAGQRALNERLVPTLNTEMTAANTAGEMLPRLQGQADRMGAAAASKVEDVRRFTAAAERARNTPVTPVPGQPRVPVRYTYQGELAQRADEVAETAARGSLAFGEARRFAQAGADSLAAHGLKPLEAAPIVARIQAKLADPKTMPGNDVLAGAMRQVADDIANWTKAGGVIDAWALDSIRKNSVNAAIARLRPGMDAKAQNKLAAGVLSDIRPLVTEAIESAGGTGYGQYLKSYSEGMRQIGERKMGAELLKLYETSPGKFADIVEGNAPKAVEKVFGPGNIDIAEQMSPSALRMVRQIAQRVRADEAIARQVPEGERAYELLLRDRLSLPRVANWFNPVVTTTNRAIETIENKLGKKVLAQLTAAAQDGRTLREALDRVPATERLKVLRTLREAGAAPVAGAAVGRAVSGASVNALAGERERQ